MKKFNTFLKNILKFVLAGNNLWSACAINEKSSAFQGFLSKKGYNCTFFLIKMHILILTSPNINDIISIYIRSLSHRRYAELVRKQLIFQIKRRRQ